MDFLEAGLSLFLLTPLREGRLVGKGGGLLRHGISTHAPAGGATPKGGTKVLTDKISTHAPAGGATFYQG